jgi:YfiR/HmsC-like
MRSAALLVTMLLGVAPLCADVMEDARVDEYQVKAAFLYNFAKFVEWPHQDARRAIFVLGIAGNDRIVQVVDSVVRGKTVHGRPLQLRTLRPDEDPRECDMLFVAMDEDRQAADLVRRARDGAVLTIGEGDLFLRDGGMIRFVADGNRIRFQINTASAREAGFTISSQLLSLALP